MWLEKKEEEFNKSQPGQTNAPQVGAGGGAAPVGSTTPTTGPTTSSIASPQTTQKWATAQDYLKANQPQASELGQKVETSLTGQLGEQKSAIESAAQKAQADIEAGTTAFNPDIAETAKTTPTAITESPEKLEGFLKQWNASYKGPTSLEATESYTPAVEAATKAKETGENIKTAGGRTNILQNQFGVYGAGNQAIDQALLQTAPQYGNIQQLAPQFTGLTDYLTQQSTGLSEKAQAAQQTTQAAQQQTREALAGNLQKFQDELAGRVANTKAEAQPIIQGYLADLASGDMQKVVADLRKVGIPNDQVMPIIQNLYILQKAYNTSLDLSQAYSYNPETAITTQNVATPEDYAKAQAWAQLTGEQGYTSILNPVTEGQAGQIPSAETAFNPAYITQRSSELVKQKDDYKLNDISPTKARFDTVMKDKNNSDAGYGLAAEYIWAAIRQGAKPPYTTHDSEGWRQRIAAMSPALGEIEKKMWDAGSSKARNGFYAAFHDWANNSGEFGQAGKPDGQDPNLASYLALGGSRNYLRND